MELLNEYVGGSRHGTLNITFKDLESEMNEVGNIGDFVVRKKSNVSDKVNHEFEIIPIGNVTGKGEEKGGIRIYDYKFGFNPAEELTDKEHSFSVGGDDKGDTLSLLKFLFPKRARGYFEKNISNIDPDAWSESPSYGKLGTEIDEEMSDKDKDFEKAKEADRLENHPERDKIKAIQALLNKEKLKKESTGPSDKAETEDDVVNVDKVSSPSAKGVGYGAETSDNTAEDDQEDKEIQNPPPMYSMKEDMNLTNLAKKLGIDVDDLKNKIGMDLIQDLLEDDVFDIDDVVQHLANELNSYYDNFLGAGERLNSIEIDENGDSEDFTKELKEASAEESIADYIIDYYTNPKTGEKIIDDDIVMAYFKTHPDYMDRFDGTPEGMKDGLDDFQEFLLVNYDIPGAGEMDEAKKMEDLKEQFKRFR